MEENIARTFYLVWVVLTMGLALGFSVSLFAALVIHGSKSVPLRQYLWQMILMGFLGSVLGCVGISGFAIAISVSPLSAALHLFTVGAAGALILTSLQGYFQRRDDERLHGGFQEPDQEMDWKLNKLLNER